MARSTDRDRLLWLLQEQGGTSNQQVRSVLNLSDRRYKKLKQQLVENATIERYRCRGGGIRLTTKGLGEKILASTVSAVGSEKELYAHLISVLQAEAKENEETAALFDTSALRKRGKWSNPDVAKVAIRTFPILRTHKVFVTTYEVKQWRRWNVDAIFEAASHRRFAHESYVVLEWAKGVPVEGLEELTAACSRFGVGLMTLHPHYKSFRHTVQLEAEPNVPADDFVEEFLGYVFERQTNDQETYDRLWETFEA